MPAPWPDEGNAPAEGRARDAVTPSEIVLLRANDLIMSEAAVMIRGKTPLFHGQEVLDFVPSGAKFRLAEGRAELPADAWALAMLSIAFLTLEQRGVFTFEVRESRHLAGLLRSEGLAVIPTAEAPRAGRWPSPSLEGSLAYTTSESQISDLVGAWLGEDSQSPGTQALARGRENLVQRGLIDEERVSRLVFFTASRFTVPAMTAELLPSEDEVLNLVEDCLQHRPEVWARLNKDVWQGLMSREDTPDYSYGYD